LKVAFDEHIPIALVRVFEIFVEERSLKKRIGGVAIESAKNYAPAPGDPDYSRGSDVPWIRRYSRAGGKVIISGDTRMKSLPHERLALMEEGMIVVFFSSKWSGWKFPKKCALLLVWWPVVVETVRTAQPGSFFRVPTSWDESGDLDVIPTVDRRLMKIERQMAARPTVAAARKRKSTLPDQPSLNLDLDSEVGGEDAS
jgi:hypothetical protein